MGPLLVPTQCTEKIQLSVIRQERYNGCGGDFVGADMRVIYRLINKTNHAIYIFGFSSDHLFMPAGYGVELDVKNQGWKYPTGNNRPALWSDWSSEYRSAKIIEPGKFVEFDGCHSTRETKDTFARTVYISCDPKAEPTELISDQYRITPFK
jgi:hypothetical protein